MIGQDMLTRCGRRLWAGAIVIGALLVILPQEAEAMSNLRCEIRRLASPAGVELVGVVWAEPWTSASISGSYEFIVNKEGYSGSSRVVQRGLLLIEDDQPKIIGTIGVSAGSGDRYFARLTITSDGLEAACRADLDMDAV